MYARYRIFKFGVHMPTISAHGQSLFNVQEIYESLVKIQNNLICVFPFKEMENMWSPRQLSCVGKRTIQIYKYSRFVKFPVT